MGGGTQANLLDNQEDGREIVSRRKREALNHESCTLVRAPSSTIRLENAKRNSNEVNLVHSMPL
jgi:hypothetical protein